MDLRVGEDRSQGRVERIHRRALTAAAAGRIQDFQGEEGGRVEDWRRCSEGPAYPLLPVSVGSASLAEP
jgi:hypothetical protein